MNWEDHIEDYLENRLQPELRAAFEQEMGSNEALRNAVELYRDTHMLLHVAGYEAQRNRIRKLDQRSSGRIVWRAAAAVALLVLLPLALYLFGPWRGSTAMDYFQPYPDRISTLGMSSDPLLQEAMEFYTAGEYKQALERFAQCTPDPEERPLLDIYIAVSHLALGDCQPAISVLSPHLSRTEVTREASQWYYILALVECDREAEAITALQHYLDEPANHFNRGMAEALLRELNGAGS